MKEIFVAKQEVLLHLFREELRNIMANLKGAGVPIEIRTKLLNISLNIRYT
jgi:hypothetical protein